MKQTLYNKVVERIIEDQNKYYRLVYSYVQNKEDALDVVQNAICKALEHYDTLKNEGAIRTWIYRILVNESLLFLKKKKREVLADSEDQEDLPYYEEGYEPQDHLYDQINRLDPETQTIIKLHYFEEFTLKEIAGMTDMNLNTVKAKLYRGLERLKQNLKEMGE